MLSGDTEQLLQLGLETRQQLLEVKAKQVFCSASTSSDFQQKRKAVTYVTTRNTEVLDKLIASRGKLELWCRAEVLASV